MLGIIKRFFKLMLNQDSFLLLYKTLVRSQLEFINSVWCPFKLGLVEDLEKVQRRATKLLTHCRGLVYENRLKLLKLPTLKYRCARGDMIRVYKIFNEIYDKDVAQSLNLAQQSITRGNSFKLSLSRCTYEIYKFSFNNRIVHLWNSLPDDIVLSSSLNIFKNKLDKFWEKDIYLCDYKLDFYSMPGLDC